MAQLRQSGDLRSDGIGDAVSLFIVQSCSQTTALTSSPGQKTD